MTEPTFFPEPPDDPDTVVESPPAPDPQAGDAGEIERNADPAGPM